MSGPRYGTVDTEYALRLASTPAADDGPVWMVNLMQYRAIADYGDHAEASAGRTGREADDAYAPTESLEAVGAEIVYVAEVEHQFLGEGKPWDRVAIVKYPTRRAFIEMQERADFKAKHIHKDAGMERTFVIGCQPVVPQLDERPGFDIESADWSTVAHPPTDSDGVCHVLHVIKWNERGTETMEGYHAEAFEVAARHGGRVAGWLAAEGTIVGDGRTWDEVRFNEFPSLAEFMEVVADPARLQAQADYREPAMADTYTLICRPVINRLRASFT
ncbi:MAG: hypothetical protein R2695_06380 [Acidimicrobiales bacterium]